MGGVVLLQFLLQEKGKTVAAETRAYPYGIYQGSTNSSKSVTLKEGTIHQIIDTYHSLKNDGLFPVILGHNKRRKLDVLYRDNYFGTAPEFEPDNYKLYNALNMQKIADAISNKLGEPGSINPDDVVVILVYENILKGDATELLNDKTMHVYSSISVLESPRETDMLPSLGDAYVLYHDNFMFSDWYIPEDNLSLYRVLEALSYEAGIVEGEKEERGNHFTQTFTNLALLAIVKSENVDDIQFVYATCFVQKRSREIMELTTYVSPTRSDFSDDKLQRKTTSQLFNSVMNLLDNDTDLAFFNECLRLDKAGRIEWGKNNLHLRY